MEDEFDDKAIFFIGQHIYLPPNRSYILDLKYSPKIPDFVSYRRLKISCVGGNNEILEIFGRSLKMNVRISETNIYFKQIKMGK